MIVNITNKFNNDKILSDNNYKSNLGLELK